MSQRILLKMLFFIQMVQFVNGQMIYFPPNMSEEWDTVDATALGWLPDPLEELSDYLEDQNSRAFILLKDGKIVMERYYNNFSATSNWYWASAGKSLTAAIVGIAQEEGRLNIHDAVSTYLGSGWTSLPDSLESKIKIIHLLTMTSGLDDRVSNPDCTAPECLVYKVPAGSRWAYHNGPYTLLNTIVSNAVGQPFNVYMNLKLLRRCGMQGAFLPAENNIVMFSTARSFARFGLLTLANGDWDNEQLITDKNYIHEMLNSSTDLNESYGYLWWLNGKSSYKLPVLDFVFSGSLFQNAPTDLVAALGKDGQIIHIVPSLGIVLIRMGDAPSNGGGAVSLGLSNDIWSYLNRSLEGTNQTYSQVSKTEQLKIYPNPAKNRLHISGPEGNYLITNSQGLILDKIKINHKEETQLISLAQYLTGYYRIIHQSGHSASFIVKE
jgi:CubicO group peptidase (beta-lactamase class C family)